MQPYFRYPSQPQHPMQPFQVSQPISGFPGMQRQTGSVDRFLGSVGGGGISGGTNVFTMLNNVQKVLKVAETMGPMIKQYGPAMRNLPSIMNALKDFQNGAVQKKDTASEPGASNEPEIIEKKKEIKEQNEKKKDTPAKKNKEIAAEAKSTPSTSKKKSAPFTRPVPSRPKANVPKGYQLSGPKLYV
jgi:hypothetical protein